MGVRAILSAVVLLLVVCHVASAVPQVGESPKLEFVALDGTKVNLEALRGKIVVIDFWATWCGPCMAEAEHLVQIHETYGEKGLEMIGISLDDDKSAVQQVVKQAKFDWPHHFDGRGWENQFAVQWGVNSIPRTFLIGPDGKILWTGHSARIDAAIEDAFANHPPELLDAASLALALAAIDRAEVALVSGDSAKAVAAVAELPTIAQHDTKISPRLTAMQPTLSGQFPQLLAAADAMVEQKKFSDAVPQLRGLSMLGYADATQRLATVEAMPEMQAHLAATKALSDAQAKQSAGNNEDAYIGYQQIVKTYPDTAAARTASEAIAKYQKDPKFVKDMEEKQIGAKARSLLSVADSYAKAGRKDLAREKLQAVIDQFPNTTYAQTAAKQLKLLK